LLPLNASPSPVQNLMFVSGDWYGQTTSTVVFIQGVSYLRQRFLQRVLVMQRSKFKQ